MKNAYVCRFMILALALLLAALPGLAGAEDTRMTEQEEEEFFYSTMERDPDALFAGYVDSLFSGAGLRGSASDTAGSLLTGDNLLLYNELKRVVLDIAKGDRTSTVITYTLAVFGLDGKLWTAEELGVDAIVENGSVTDEATQAVRKKVQTKIDEVLDALLMDCVYEMFWYDKSQSSSMHSANQYIPSYSDGVYYLEWRCDYTVRMPVCSDYASGANAVDLSAIQAAQAAASNARQIVGRYARATDLEKLNGYRQEICALVSYNHDAADDPTTAYGNPWQLIWVFDGDTDTNVVCEGYSKAFQYLCEQTRFASPLIRCIPVRGYMGQSDMGAHMWNVLRMDDGKNYIADITNCDSGSVGSPDLLFLKGCAQGSVNDVYVYLCRNTGVGYAYSDDTLEIYPESWLEMSAEDYAAPAPWLSLESVTVPADTEEIRARAFEGDGMAMVTIPEGVKVIGELAFANCSNLRYVYLPESLTSIADNAFSGCENLTVLCVRNGSAEAYALAHGFACEYPDE